MLAGGQALAEHVHHGLDELARTQDGDVERHAGVLRTRTTGFGKIAATRRIVMIHDVSSCSTRSVVATEVALLQAVPARDVPKIQYCTYYSTTKFPVKPPNES